MFRKKQFLAASLTLGLFAVPAFAAGLTDGNTVAHNTPKFVSSARNMGQVDPNTVMEVSIWLKPHNKAGLDAMARELYDPTSPKFRKWLTKAEFSAQFAPTAAEAGTVSQFFAANKMKVVTVGPNNFFVRASGTAAAVSAAFHVSLNNYLVDGKTVRANSADPYVSGEASALVKAVAGLDTMEYTHPLVTRASTRTVPGASDAPAVVAKAATPKPEIASAASSSEFNPQCIVGQTTQTFTTSGSLPTATYTGNEYSPAPAACGYTPQNIYTAYNMYPLYAEHYDGTGQTIVIIDWCGSPTIMADANAFSAKFNLPKLTSKNFTIINTPSPSYCSAPDPEINIDVEWAHAIAPGAAIDLVVPPTANFQDVDQGYFYAVNYQLGNTISGSYGSEELYTPTTVLETEDLISEIAAVSGIAANFSTGDDGDFTYDFPQYYSPSVSAPADSSYVTGVGGVSLSLHTNGSIAWQIGWGTNENLLAADGSIEDPPAGGGFFNFGSGGGESGFFAKPSYQSTLPGSGRQLPDISWLADPFTGAYIAISEPFSTPEVQYQVYGGTSLACPMFAGLWAIANQEAGQPLGQAAPYLYGLPKKAIQDIALFNHAGAVSGVVKDSTGTTSYTATDLAEPVEGATGFVTAIWDYPLSPGVAYLLTFGTDSGLTVGPGWDNVTGLGVPNPKAFADSFKQ